MQHRLPRCPWDFWYYYFTSHISDNISFYDCAPTVRRVQESRISQLAPTYIWKILTCGRTGKIYPYVFGFHRSGYNNWWGFYFGFQNTLETFLWCLILYITDIEQWWTQILLSYRARYFITRKQLLNSWRLSDCFRNSCWTSTSVSKNGLEYYTLLIFE